MTMAMAMAMAMAIQCNANGNGNGNAYANSNAMQMKCNANAMPIVVLYAFGHHHVGWTLGGITGQLIAELAEGKEPTSVDITPYRLDRFGFDFDFGIFR